MRSLARQGDLLEVRERIGRLSAEDAARWGRMRAGEMVCHVREAFRLGLGELQAAARPSIGLPRGVVKLLALRMPMHWPKGVATVPELAGDRPGLQPGEFARDREGLLEILGRFAERRENRTEHPILGTMQPEDWMRWGYLHTDHHLRQFGR